MMIGEFTLHIEPLEQKAFQIYGRAIIVENQKPDSSGVDWDCWSPLGRTSNINPIIGLVTVVPGHLTVEVMEREPLDETIIPVEKPIIQVVSLGQDLNDPVEKPDIARARAFIIYPGQAIIMNAGTWHAAAKAWVEKASYFYIANQRSLIPGWKNTGWVPFLNNETIRLEDEFQRN